VTDVEFETTDVADAEDVEIPDALPVLPLKEMVVFPDSATPLAIGQERSIALIDDVVARDGKLALVTVKDSEVE
jgi:ATP-dependent Lon protease